VRPRSANARHECFVIDASVSVKPAETAELDEHRSSDGSVDRASAIAEKSER
jgi:hypothetical protein